MTIEQDAAREQARNEGAERPDDPWILTWFDTWEPNPFYTGPRVPHPETESFEDDEGDFEPFEPDEDDRSEFADPGGRSALRAATPTNPRNLPCPTCGRPNLLTPADRALGYQCDACADHAEGRGPNGLGEY